MKKNLKSLLALIGVILLTILSGCGGNNSNLVGRWEESVFWGTEVIALEFFSDGTGRYEETRWSIIDDFVWERRNGILTLTFDGRESEHYYEILGDGTILRLTLENGDVLELRKME